MKHKTWWLWFVLPVAILATGVWVKLSPDVNISRAVMVGKVKHYIGQVHDVLVEFPPLERLAHHIKQNATSDLSVNTSSYSSSGSSDPSSGSASSSSVSSASSAPDHTPIEGIVQGVQLANTYYYHFATGTPANVKTVFTRAVAVYNQTGIVNLRAGQGTSLQNQITLGTYHKQMPANARGTLELGKGGPEVIKHINEDKQVTATVNHADAELNVSYGDAVALPVALHELGHALGLDHSQNKTSIMYPIDQGVTSLSTADLNGLKFIYHQQQ